MFNLPRDYTTFIYFTLTPPELLQTERFVKAYILSDNHRGRQPKTRIRGEFRLFVPAMTANGSQFRPHYSDNDTHLLSIKPSEMKRIIEFIKGGPDGNDDAEELTLYMKKEEDGQPRLFMSQFVPGFREERAARLRTFVLDQRECRALVEQYEKSNHDMTADAALAICDPQMNFDRSTVDNANLQNNWSGAYATPERLKVSVASSETGESQSNGNTPLQTRSPDDIQAAPDATTFANPPASPENMKTPWAPKKAAKRKSMIDDISEDDDGEEDDDKERKSKKKPTTKRNRKTKRNLSSEFDV